MADHELHALTVAGIQQHGERESPLLLLEDDLGRQLGMPIGICEALAIQRMLERQTVTRPLTHDLMLTLAERLDSSVSRAIIDDYSGGTYYARLILKSVDGSVSLDCRPSDAIALALRANAPILATDAVMEGEEGDGDR